jgi:hypothetical protein
MPQSGMMGDLMGSAYEVRPVPIGRSARRRPTLILVASAVLLALVLVKPWAWSSGPPAVTAAVATDDGPIASAGVTEPVATPVTATLGSLALRSGTWGVGVAGLGPRYDATPWIDWVAVEPEPATDSPSRVAMWPGTGICDGVPVLLVGPLFIAITGPGDLPVDRRLVAWWSDGGRTTSLEGSVRQVTPLGDPGISYLVRDDREPWPSGRYEFHLVAGDRAVALTVCLAASG